MAAVGTQVRRGAETAGQQSNEIALRQLPMRRAGIVALCGLYALLWGVAALLPLNATDLDAFFLPSARIAASGHPLDVYAVRYLAYPNANGSLAYPNANGSLAYPNANGPLSLAPLTAIVVLAGRLGWLDDPSLRRMLVMAVFSLFSLLLGREALLAIDRFRPEPLRARPRMLAYAVILFSPELWHSVLFYGHVELPLMLWLALSGTRMLAARRVWRAGALLGLALLTRSSAVVFVLPLALLLARQRRWSETLRFGSAAGGTLALGLLPFWVADRSDLIYSLVSFRQLLPVAGGTFWRLTYGTPLLAIGERWDSAAVLAAAMLVCVVVLALRPELDVDSRDLYGLLAACALCFPLGIKTLWPYYFLDAYTLLAIWWLVHPRPAASSAHLRWWLGLLGPAATVAIAQLAEAIVTHFANGIWDVSSSLSVSVPVLALTLALLLRLCLSARRERLPAAYGV